MFIFIHGGCVDRHKHIQHHILRRYARLCFQEDLLHIAYATTTPVGSYRRDLWIFLYEVYFVWFLSVYFQCAEYERLWALGLRRLGCGSLWDDCSPRPVGNQAFHMSLITHVPGNIWARIMGMSVSLSLRSTGTRKQALVSRQMPPKIHFPST